MESAEEFLRKQGAKGCQECGHNRLSLEGSGNDLMLTFGHNTINTYIACCALICMVCGYVKIFAKLPPERLEKNEVKK